MKKRQFPLIVLMALLMFVNKSTKAQEEITQEKNNYSIGLGIRSSWCVDNSIVLQMKKHNKLFSWRVTIEIGTNRERSNLPYYIHPFAEVLEPEDSNGILTIENGVEYSSQNYNSISFGFEKPFNIYKLKFALGLDVNVGHLSTKVVQGISRYQYPQYRDKSHLYYTYKRDPDHISTINKKTTIRKSLAAGTRLNLDWILPITNKLELEAGLSFHLYVNHLLNETIEYQNEKFDQNFSNTSYNSPYLSDATVKVGLNYHF